MKLNVAFLFLMVLFTGLSCNKKSNVLPPVTDQDQLVSADVVGQVLDEAGIPIEAAVVRLGTQVCKTDSDGAFQFIRISTPRNKTVLEVSKPGYFTGVRTLYILANEDNYALIRLMEKKSPMQFHSQAGGNISVDGGGTIFFPANSIVNKQTGATYAGMVSVYSTWIDPSSSTFGDVLPGALRGIDSSGGEKRLESYGMIGAELYDDQGQALQLAPGSLADLSFPIPSVLLAGAPKRIPLWYFDETTGMWQEQGEAQLQGAVYRGQVAHFSFWNCDQPEYLVPFEACIKNGNGSPLANVKVKLTNTENSTFAYDYTNSLGKVRGSIPRQANMKMELILTPCEMSLYTTTFSTSNSPVTMNDIQVNVPDQNMVILAGTILNCMNSICKNAYLKYKRGHTVRFIKGSGNGNFYASLTECVTPLEARLTAYDYEGFTAGDEKVIQLHAGLNNLGMLNACGNIFEQFVQWESTVNGVRSLLAITPVDGQFAGGIDTFDYPGLNGVSAGNSTETAGVMLVFDGPSSVSGNHYLKYYGDHLDWDMMADTGYSYVNTIIPVMVTRYDSIGGKIEGSFEGSIKGLFIPERKVKCTFRVDRIQ